MTSFDLNSVLIFLIEFYDFSLVDENQLAKMILKDGPTRYYGEVSSIA